MQVWTRNQQIAFDLELGNYKLTVEQLVIDTGNK